MLEAGLFSAARARVLEEAGLGPGARFKLAEALALAGDGRDKPPSFWHINWRDALALEPGGWARFPKLAELPLGLLDPSLHAEIRVAACRWLGDFPSTRTVRGLREVLLDDKEDARVRDEAARTLGARQLFARDDTLFIAHDVGEAADRALAEAASGGLLTKLEHLDHALRHVRSSHLSDSLMQLPVVEAARCVDAFATEALARRLLASLHAVPATALARVVGLVASVLGAEAGPALLEHARRVPLSTRAEVLFSALAVYPERAAEPTRALLAAMPMMRTWALRYDWHEANPGILPVPRALSVARKLAEIPPPDRPSAAARAAADLAARSRIEPFADHELDELWWWMAFHAEPTTPRALLEVVERSPRALERIPQLVRRTLSVLAQLGRANELEGIAIERSAVASATWYLACHGWPRRALRFSARLSAVTTESVAGTTLALVGSSRVDLQACKLEYSIVSPK